ncbi:MAG: membrane protein FxsA [Hyphomicrobiales bacterium]|nr:membrane protein FxsA [Hyphomicrobiales bacterium]
MRISLLPLTFILLPALEIATFIAVGRAIGVLPTLGLIFLTSLAGIMLLRAQGLGLLERLRQGLRAGESPEAPMMHGAMIAMAGLLLIIPGFITDAIGFLLFIPAVREFAWSLIGRRFIVRGSGYRASPGSAPRDGKTIDLDADDYSPGPNPSSPWLKRRKD